MSNFITRTLSGAVYVALVVLSIFVHPIFFGVLFSIITILAVREFVVSYHHVNDWGTYAVWYYVVVVQYG